MAAQESTSAPDTEAENRSHEKDAGLFCPNCGYDLRSIPSDRCPECGMDIDRAGLPRSRVPWVHRRQLGWVRAYLRTVRFALLSPKSLAAEIARPVDYQEAQRFRWVTVATVWMTSIVVAAAWWFSRDSGERTRITVFLYPEMSGVWLTVLTGIAMVVGIMSLTGVASYFFHPRSLPVVQQNRAIALSYYACGILSVCGLLLACPGGIALAALWLNEHLLIRMRPVLNFLLAITALGGAVSVFAYVAIVITLLRRITGCGIIRTTGAQMSIIVGTVLSPAIVLSLPIVWKWMALILGLSAS